MKQKSKSGYKTMIKILLLFLLTNLIVAMSIARPKVEKVLLISHRGGPAYQPENTKAAFTQAIADGVDAIEFDIQMTSDGYLVVVHDDEVDRTTNGTGFVKDMTLEEIQALDAGNGEKIPTFEQILLLARLTNTMVLAEVKSPENFPGIEAEISKFIRVLNYSDNSIIQSFSEESVSELESINNSASLCQLYGTGKIFVPTTQAGNAKYACVMAEMLLINPWMIHWAHQNDITVYVWPGVLDNPWMARIVLALGADGIMSDDQLMLAEVMGR